MAELGTVTLSYSLLNIFYFYCFILLLKQGSQRILFGGAQWLKHQTNDQKVTGSNPGRSNNKIFFSRINFLC